MYFVVCVCWYNHHFITQKLMFVKQNEKSWSYDKLLILFNIFINDGLMLLIFLSYLIYEIKESK